MPANPLRVIGYWLLCAFLACSAFAALLLLHQERPAAALALEQPTLINPRNVVSAGAERVTLPHDWRRSHLAAGHLRYRFEIPINTQPQRLWALYIPSLEMTAEVRLNGIVIGGRSGRPSEPSKPSALDRYWGRPTLLTIPRSLLERGSNVLDIDLWAEPTWGRLSKVYLGPEAQLRPAYAKRFFWRVTVLKLTATTAFLLAAFMLAIGMLRRAPTYLWFATFAAAWALHNLFYATVQVPIANLYWDLSVYLVLGLLALSASMFAFRFLERPHPRYERGMLWIFGSGSLVLAAAATIGSHSLLTALAVAWNLLLLTMSTYPAALLLRRLSALRDGVTVLLASCYLFALLAGGHDWLAQAGLGSRRHGMLLQFAAAPMLITIGFLLLERFSRALSELSLLNLELEQRVAEKVSEVEAAFETQRQLEAENLLSAERLRIMRDMHDGVGGHLISLLNQFDRDQPREARWAGAAEQALSDLRLMIDSLEEVDDDLVVALGLLRHRVQPQLDAAGIALEWDVDELPEVPDLRPARVLHFLRILQEAVTNCVRHSGATMLSFRTRRELYINGTRCLGVCVRDNGRGLCDAATGAGRAASHHGLRNMRDRALQGDFLLELKNRDPGQGFELRIGVPKSPERASATIRPEPRARR